MIMLILMAPVFIVAALFASAVRRVPVGQVYSLYRRGKMRRVLQAGTHLVMPLLDKVVHKINMAGQILRFEEPLANERDVRGTVYWQVLEPERADAIFEQVDQLIRRSAHEVLSGEAEVGGADRKVLGGRMKQVLNSALRERGMMVTRVDLDLA